MKLYGVIGLAISLVAGITTVNHASASRTKNDSGNQSGTLTVNCNNSESLQKAINNLQGNPTLVRINVSGTCSETIDIGYAKVHLVGTPSATLSSPSGLWGIKVPDAAYLEIENFSIRPQFGHTVDHGIAILSGRVHGTNLDVTGFKWNGLVLKEGATARLNQSTVKDSQYGIHAESSTISLVDPVISESEVAVDSTRDSHARIRGTTATSCSISSSNIGLGVYLGATAEVEKCTLQSSSGGRAIMVNSNSSASLRESDVTGGTYGAVSMINSSIVLGGTVNFTGQSEGSLITEALSQIVIWEGRVNSLKPIWINQGSLLLGNSSVIFDVPAIGCRSFGRVAEGVATSVSDPNCYPQAW